MKAAIYTRVSTSAQAGEDKVSLPEQARELLALTRPHPCTTVRHPRRSSKVTCGGGDSWCPPAAIRCGCLPTGS